MLKMKSTIKLILASTLFIIITHFSFAQKSEVVNFKDIDLTELKKTIIQELLKDGLIEKRKDNVHLALRSEMTLLNDEVLSEKQHEKYGSLAAQFKIDRGSYRTIYITRQCIAVGDFYENSFSGTIRGKMDIDELTVSIR